LGCVIDPSKKDHVIIDRSNIGSITIVWRAIGEKSEGGDLDFVLRNRIPSSPYEITLSCDIKKIQFGQSVLCTCQVKNNTGLILQLKMVNRDEKTSAIGIHMMDVTSIKIDAKKETSFEILLFGRKKGIHKLNNLKISNILSNSNKYLNYDPLEFEIYEETN